MAIGHVYKKYDVLSHELKHLKKYQILKLVMKKPVTYVD